MVISQPALICLEASWRRVARGLVSCCLGPFGRAGTTTSDARRGLGTGPTTDLLPTSSTEPAAEEPVAAVESDAVEPTPLTATERRARAAALRGLLLARQRRFEAAEAAFAEAARLDPALDLSSIPTFWRLERGGHEAAVRAYEEAGRTREAAMLETKLRSTFRPRLVRTRPEPSPISP